LLMCLFIKAIYVIIALLLPLLTKSISDTLLEGRVTHNEGRKHWAEAKVLNAEGTMLAQGKGLFIEVRPRES